MDTRRRRNARKPVPAEKPKPKRPVARDMSIYARHLRLPTYQGFVPVSKADISADVRAMAGLPASPSVDPERDPLLLPLKDVGPPWAEGRGVLPKKLIEAIRGKPSAPSWPPSDKDRKDGDKKDVLGAEQLREGVEPDAADAELEPEFVSSLETAVFRGEADEDFWGGEEEYNDLALPAPSKAMSGWTAARLAMEGGVARVSTTRAPLTGTGVAATAAAGAGAGASGSIENTGPTFGQPRGAAAGTAMGMEGVRMDLGLLDRLRAILPVRREETESRYLALRRQYVSELKKYFVEAQEMGVSIEQLRSHVAATRKALRAGDRPDAFATDEEEWLAVDRMVAATAAVVRQNRQLRARLASATGRISGNAAGEPDSAEAASASSGAGAAAGDQHKDVMLVVDPSGAAVTGGVKPLPSSKTEVLNLANGKAATAALKEEGKGRGRRAASASAGADKDEMDVDGAGAGASSSASTGAGAAPKAAKGTITVPPPAGSTANNKADEDMDGVTTGAHQYHVRSRHAPRSMAFEVAVSIGRGGAAGAAAAAFVPEPVLAVGDLVLTPYGRGVVLKQRDVQVQGGQGAAKTEVQPHPAGQPSPPPAKTTGSRLRIKNAPAATAEATGASSSTGNTGAAIGASVGKTGPSSMVEVLLRFGAKAYLLSSQVVLLAVAGEEYTGPESGDAVLLAAVMAARARATGKPAVLTGHGTGNAYIADANGAGRYTGPHADDILYGPKKASASAEAAAKAGASSAAAGAGASGPSAAAATVAKGKAGQGAGATAAGLHGSSSAEASAESEWERTAAARMAIHVRNEDGVTLSHRTPVFRTTWERNRVPRGVPLRIDPLRGTSTLGYIVGALGGPALIHGVAAYGVSSAYGPAFVGGGAAVAGAAVGAGAAGAEPVPTSSPGDHAGAGSSGGALAGMGTPGSLYPTTPGAPRPHDATQQSRELFAEVTRLRGQLRQSEESRTEQRKRLTDARLTIARLLEQLNETRSSEAEMNKEVNRREKEVTELQERIHELRRKYEPQALAADEAREAEAEAKKKSAMAGAGAAAASAAMAMEALVASMSADADDEEDEEAGPLQSPSEDEEDMPGLPGPRSSPLKPGTSPGGLGRAGAGASVSAGSAGGTGRKPSASGYRGIMSTQDEDESDGSDKEDGGPGAAAVGEGAEDEDLEDVDGGDETGAEGAEAGGAGPVLSGLALEYANQAEDGDAAGPDAAAEGGADASELEYLVADLAGAGRDGAASGPDEQGDMSSDAPRGGKRPRPASRGRGGARGGKRGRTAGDGDANGDGGDGNGDVSGAEAGDGSASGSGGGDGDAGASQELAASQSSAGAPARRGRSAGRGRR